MIDENSIPTIADWGDYEADIDTKWTFNRFHQKNFKETATIFANWIGEPSFEMSYMPIIPFQYYMTAFSHYVRSAVMQGAFDFENHNDLTYYFFCINNILREKPDFILPIWDEIQITLDIIPTHAPAWFTDEAVLQEYVEGYPAEAHAKFTDELSNVLLSYQNALANLRGLQS